MTFEAVTVKYNTKNPIPGSLDKQYTMAEEDLQIHNEY